VLCWAGAAKRLKDRDTWIGWDAVTCANRLNLVVQLRRFVVPAQSSRPNLASQCLGLLCGAPGVKAMWAKCGPLNQHQRAAIGLKRRDKKSGLLRLPGYDALNDIINQVNPNSLARAINQWLAAHSDISLKNLAIDGKDLGGKGKLGAIVTLCHHHSGAPLAMRTYGGEKIDCGLPVSQTLLKQAAPFSPTPSLPATPSIPKKRH
jgi:hypothetical protein